VTQDFQTQDVADAEDSPHNVSGKDLVELQHLRAQKAIIRKYRQLRREIQEDPYLFNHEHFAIDPLNGEIWPSGIKESTVAFHPKSSQQYSAVAYCQVTGREQRLQLEIKGAGIGPQAVFSYEILDIGRVGVRSENKFLVELRNVGDIEAAFEYIGRQEKVQRDDGPGSERGGSSDGESVTKFTFTPERGVLGVGAGTGGLAGKRAKLARAAAEATLSDYPDRVVIQVDFTASHVGALNEVHLWRLRGRGEPLKLSFSGRVMGPTFRFDQSELVFDTCSFGFKHSLFLTLSNTSNINLPYTARIPADDEAVAQAVFKRQKQKISGKEDEQANIG
jgi:hydrocephalus-inducing protein